LGKVLLARLLGGTVGNPERIVIFSRDEAKQHALRVQYARRHAATDDIIYRNFDGIVKFHIGDIRDYASVATALQNIDIVVNAAALKQVPTCEYFPFEAVQTNICGPQNIVRAIGQLGLPVETVVGVSTDKAVEPVNVMGMTKAIQERVFSGANLSCRSTRFVLVRYGNVLASRGSVISLFHEQISQGGPVTITDSRMTRFLLTLEDAVDTILAAVATGKAGETFVPQVGAALIVDIAKALIEDRNIPIKTIGIRPGEKLHEVLVSAEEAGRTQMRNGFFVITPLLPDLRTAGAPMDGMAESYCSANGLMDSSEVRALLVRHGLTIHSKLEVEGELLR
jgi:UDP-glucose 4-epimerase